MSPLTSRFGALLAITTVVLTSIRSAGAVCASGEIGVGIVTGPFFVLGSLEERAGIVDDTCSIIDSKGTNDTDICGTYIGGSSVSCTAGTETPQTVETLSGETFTDCTQSGTVCDTGTIDQTVTVEFCCIRQFPQ